MKVLEKDQKQLPEHLGMTLVTKQHKLEKSTIQCSHIKPGIVVSDFVSQPN